MAQVIIDDRRYISAQEFLGGVYFDRRRLGLGDAFEEWVRKVVPSVTTDRLARLDGMIRALMEYSGADYPTADLEDDKTLVWSFHRAWVDRFGWAYSVPERPAD